MCTLYRLDCRRRCSDNHTVVYDVNVGLGTEKEE